MRQSSGILGGSSVLAASVVFLVGVAASASAQTLASSAPAEGVNWGLVDAVGYGGLGFGLGVMATWDLEGSDFGPPDVALVIIGATTVAGVVSGAVIGHRARRSVSQGGRIGGLHSAAVIGGAVMAGGTLGALGAVPLINGEGEGTPLGSDEQAFTLLVLTGSALGALFVLRHRHEFGSRSVVVAPTRAGNAGYGFHVLVRP